MKIEKWGSLHFSPDGASLTIENFRFDTEGCLPADGKPTPALLGEALNLIADNVLANRKLGTVTPIQ